MDAGVEEAPPVVVVLLLEVAVVVNIDVNANAAFDSKVLRLSSIFLLIVSVLLPGYWMDDDDDDNKAILDKAITYSRVLSFEVMGLVEVIVLYVTYDKCWKSK